MTPREIAEHLLTQTTLDEDTMAPLYAYRREKRATGAPTDLENLIVSVGRECQRIADNLRGYLRRAQREADAALREMEAANPPPGYPAGVLMDRHWNDLRHERTSAEQLNGVLRIHRNHFRSLVEAWAAVADRIVATDADRAAYAAQKREQAIASLASKPARELRQMAKERGLNVGTDKAEIAAALVDAGQE